MKSKFIIVAVFASIVAMSTLFASRAEAQGWYGRGAYFVGGAIVGAAIARPYYYGPNYYGYYNPPVYYAPPPVVYVQPAPTVYVQQQYPANEYHQETIFDNNCNCYKTVLVRN